MGLLIPNYARLHTKFLTYPGDDPTIALRHAISAAKRLTPGGRLVAILPPNASGERQADLWRRFAGIVQQVARLVPPRSAFAKIGTSVETHLLIAEKRLPGSGGPRAKQHAGDPFPPLPSFAQLPAV